MTPPRLDRRLITVVTATPIESAAARRLLPGVRVCESGIALSKMHDGFGDVVISCGLAGGLPDGLLAGTVLIPTLVRRLDGTMLECDSELVEALSAACRRLGREPIAAPLLAAAEVLRGPDRARWGDRGFAGVDMETGLLQAPRVAAVRVVLDTPQRELNADWLHPVRAMFDPRNWPEAVWLSREAPRCARLAAAVVAAACS
jgi:hypothetical protein